MRPLFAHWDEVARRLASSRMIALFLDFDGTLVGIRARPELVRVHPAARHALATLACSPRFRVWVISARRRADIRARLRIPAVRYLGLYGWERSSTVPPPADPIFHVKAFLAGALPANSGVWIEDKQHTIAVHYRGASEPVTRATAELVQHALYPWRSLLRIAPGKCVWEIVPVDFADKGTAVRRELARLPIRALPVYVGDDISDEPAFAAVPHGVGIRVGTLRSTRARYRLEGAEQVCHFLERLKAEFL
jgi:trehalose-phosphatase